MKVEPIDDIVVDKTEIYIKDLEAEIDSLKAVVKKLKIELKHKPKEQDKNCCKAYDLVVKNFHRLIDEVIPF